MEGLRKDGNPHVVQIATRPIDASWLAPGQDAQIHCCRDGGDRLRRGGE